MRRLILIALLVLPAVASAAPGTQVQRLVEKGLREYRLETDVTKLTTAQAAAIHLLVSSPESDLIPTDTKTRSKLIAILRWNVATNPDLQ